MQDQNLFQLGDKLLLITIERQTILINGQIAGFVEVLFDREKGQSEARIWLYPAYRSFSASVRKWVEQNQLAHLTMDVNPEGMAIINVGPMPSSHAMPESPWSVGFRADRRHGYEVFLTDRVTGFLYPIHTSRSRRNALSVRKQVEDDLLILPDHAFAEKWGLQRIQTPGNRG